MTESALRVSVSVAAARKPAALADRLFGAFGSRLITGLIILLVWEFVVRLLAPAYVAKPTTVVLAIPRVIVDPAFLASTGATLAAVAEGLTISPVFGTIVGRRAGSGPIFGRPIRHYLNGFYAVPMFVVLPLFSLWFGYSGTTPFATI